MRPLALLVLLVATLGGRARAQDSASYVKHEVDDFTGAETWTTDFDVRDCVNKQENRFQGQTRIQLVFYKRSGGGSIALYVIHTDPEYGIGPIDKMLMLLDGVLFVPHVLLSSGDGQTYDMSRSDLARVVAAHQVRARLDGAKGHCEFPVDELDQKLIRAFLREVAAHSTGTDRVLPHGAAQGRRDSSGPPRRPEQ